MGHYVKTRLRQITNTRNLTEFLFTVLITIFFGTIVFLGAQHMLGGEGDFLGLSTSLMCLVEGLCIVAFGILGYIVSLEYGVDILEGLFNKLHMK